MENSEKPAAADAPVEGESLEGGADTTPAAGSTPEAPKPDEPKKKKKAGKGFFGKFSIYLILFVLLIIVAVMIMGIVYVQSHNKKPTKISNQDLSQSAVSQLANTDVTVGDAKQVLNVQSNAVFAGQVLARGDLQVAGKLQVGGSLAISSLLVSGQTVTDSLQVNKNIQVAGDSAVAGQLSIQKSLQVNGGGTFNGALSAPQITTNILQINGNVNFTRHIAAGGSTPSRTNGNALGGGGTASVSGSDTAGSIAINTGSNPSAGCLVTVNFANKFGGTPRVMLTPVEAGAADLNYYVTRTTGSFTVCTTNAPPASQNFGFDYIIFE